MRRRAAIDSTLAEARRSLAVEHGKVALLRPALLEATLRAKGQEEKEGASKAGSVEADEALAAAERVQIDGWERAHESPSYAPTDAAPPSSTALPLLDESLFLLVEANFVLASNCL